MIDWSNQQKGLCVICGKPNLYASYYLCTKCGLATTINEVRKLSKGKYFLLEIKSKCCNADIINMQKSTCSDQCHKQLVNEMENEFGKFKKVIDQTTQIAYKVPTKVIIEKGLNQKDLINYPKWT